MNRHYFSWTKCLTMISKVAIKGIEKAEKVTFKGPSKVSLPDEASPASGLNIVRDVKGMEEGEGLGIAKIKDAEGDDVQVGGFKGKVYNHIDLSAVIVQVILPQHIDRPGYNSPAPLAAAIESPINKYLMQAVVSITIIDKPRMSINYDLNGNDRLDPSSEYYMIYERLLQTDFWTSAEVIIVNVGLLDRIGGVRPISELVRKVVVVDGDGQGGVDQWFSRNTAHEVGHVLGLSEYENGQQDGPNIRVHDPGNLMWSVTNAQNDKLEGHLRYWQWDIMQYNAKKIKDGDVTIGETYP